jgi:hypothetical protein
MSPRKIDAKVNTTAITARTIVPVVALTIYKYNPQSYKGRGTRRDTYIKLKRSRSKTASHNKLMRRGDCNRDTTGAAGSLILSCKLLVTPLFAVSETVTLQTNDHTSCAEAANRRRGNVIHACGGPRA